MFLRRINGFELGNTIFDHSFEHVTADGKRLLIVHGDLFDRTVTKYMRVAYVGAWSHEWITVVDHGVNRRLGPGRAPISMATWLKRTAKRLIKKSIRFDETVLQHAIDEGFDGVVCGHIHRPALEHREHGIYINTGDWVENCTAVVEHFDGRLELIYWKDLAGEWAGRPELAEDLENAG